MREESLNKLAKAIENLYPILRKENRHMGVFLHQSIAKCADEKTLEKIIEDIESYMNKK